MNIYWRKVSQPLHLQTRQSIYKHATSVGHSLICFAAVLQHSSFFLRCTQIAKLVLVSTCESKLVRVCVFVCVKLGHWSNLVSTVIRSSAALGSVRPLTPSPVLKTELSSSPIHLFSFNGPQRSRQMPGIIFNVAFWKCIFALIFSPSLNVKKKENQCDFPL